MECMRPFTSGESYSLMGLFTNNFGSGVDFYDYLAGTKESSDLNCTAALSRRRSRSISVVLFYLDTDYVVEFVDKCG